MPPGEHPSIAPSRPLRSIDLQARSYGQEPEGLPEMRGYKRTLNKRKLVRDTVQMGILNIAQGCDPLTLLPELHRPLA